MESPLLRSTAADLLLSKCSFKFLVLDVLLGICSVFHLWLKHSYTVDCKNNFFSTAENVTFP